MFFLVWFSSSETIKTWRSCWLAEFVPAGWPLVFGIALGEATTTIEPGAALAKPGLAANKAGGKENVGVELEGKLFSELFCACEDAEAVSLFCISSFLRRDGSSRCLKESWIFPLFASKNEFPL